MFVKKRLILLAVLSAMMLVGFGCATAEKAPQAEKAAVDTSWHFHDIVDAAFVAQYAKLPMPKNVMIIDSRPKKPKYDNGYIPTAVSIPDSQFDKMTNKLPEAKDTLLIFYCEGPT
jgi:hypothetical protein